MIPQSDSKIITSFLLFLDNAIQYQGQAFTNQSSLFYPTSQEVAGLYSYTAPFTQMCNDTSIFGANIISGVYLNNTYVGIGQSGLVSINHYFGAVTFNQPVPQNIQISGNFAVKDVNIYLSDGPDYKVVLNQKFSVNPKYGQTITGVAEDVKIMPAIFLVPKAQETLPFAFDGCDDNRVRIRGIIVAENVYQRVCIGSILKNLRLRSLPYIAATPFSYDGSYTGGVPYNYWNLQIDPTYAPVIMSCKVTEIPERGTFESLTAQFSQFDAVVSYWGNHL